jgi:DNA-binding XRE family transcriptional regulator
MATLKQHRLQKVWTVRDLAREADVSQQSVVNGEAGKPLRLTTMRKMAEALDVSVWEVEEFATTLRAMGEEGAMSKLAA